MADRLEQAGVPRSSGLAEVVQETKRGFVTVFAISFVLNLLMLVSPIYMMQVFDRVIASGRVETLLMLTLLAFIVIGVLGCLETLRQRVLTRIGTWLDQRLAAPVLSASIDRGLKTSQPTAEPLRDLATIRGFLGGAGVVPFLDSPWVPVFVLLIFFLHPWLGVLALVSSIALFALAVMSETIGRKPTYEAIDRQQTAWRHAESAVRHGEVITAMGMQPNLLRRWSNANIQALMKQLVAADRTADLAGAIKVVRLGVQTAILGLGAYLVLQQELTSGGMIASSILLGRGLAPVEQAVGAWKQLLQARSAYARVERTLGFAEPETNKISLAKPKGRISVEGVTFMVDARERPILSDISFTLEPGEAIAIVGPSASGKSTLCRILVGVTRPIRGHVRIDGADVSTWPRAELGQHIGYLPQSVDLFEGTVAENIARMGTPESEKVIEAAQRADVHQMVLGLPQGYNTPLNEIGPFLSGGQRQRIGLARALYGRPALLVLDEPNSNLDQEGEAALMQTIDRLRAEGTTIVMVAHRTSVISHVNKLMILVDGQIRMLGPCDQVIAAMGNRRGPAARDMMQ